METKKNFLEEQYEKNTDTIKIEISVKDFQELNDYLKFYKKKIADLHIFNIKVNIEISWKDKRCRF